MLKMREYGRNLTRLRKGQGKTQEELAELANRSTYCIQQVEAGQTNATIDTLVYITEALHTDWRVPWLLCWSEEEVLAAVRRVPQLCGDPENVLSCCQNIVLLRREKGMTQKELARMANVSTAWLRDIEHGCANVTIEKLEHIANALGLSLLELFVMDIPEEARLKVIRSTKLVMEEEHAEEEQQYVSI